MKKELVNLQVVKGTAQRGTRKGQEYKYVVAELKSVGNNWLASNTTRVDKLFIMNDTLVKMFEPFICKANGGTAEGTENLQLPDDMRIINNVFRVQVPTQGNYVRINTADQLDANGRVIARKGEAVVSETGDVMLYNSIEVLAVKVQDEDTGEMYWVDSPESIARRVLSKYYRRVVQSEEAAHDSTIEAGNAEEVDDEPEESAEELEAKLEALRQKKLNGNAQ